MIKERKIARALKQQDRGVSIDNEESEIGGFTNYKFELLNTQYSDTIDGLLGLLLLCERLKMYKQTIIISYHILSYYRTIKYLLEFMSMICLYLSVSYLFNVIL